MSSALLRCVLAALVSMCNGLHRLEPPDGRIVHMSGQSPTEFGNYAANMTQSLRPLAYSFYKRLHDFHDHTVADVKKYFAGVETMLKNLGTSAGYTVVPHLAVHLAYGDGSQFHQQNVEMLKRVADGEYDDAIVRFFNGIQNIIDADVAPAVFLRLGYEFNGKWNAYTPQSNYQRVWRRISDILNKQFSKDLRDRIALIWDASCNVKMSLPELMKWYPGDDIVDWWGLNVLTEHPLSSSLCDFDGFLRQARSRKFPVLLAENMPRVVGTNHANSWSTWFDPWFNKLMLNEKYSVKGFSYINRNQPGQQDCRMEASQYGVSRQYKQILARPNVFLHGTANNTGEVCRGLGIHVCEARARTEVLV